MVINNSVIFYLLSGAGIILLFAFALVLIFKLRNRKSNNNCSRQKDQFGNNTKQKNSFIPEEVFELIESIQSYGTFLEEKDKRKIQSLLELRQFYRSFLKTQNLMASEIIALLNDAAEKLRAFNIIIGTYVTHINELRRQMDEFRRQQVIQENEYQKLELTNKKYEQMIQGLVQTQIIVLAQQASSWLDRYHKMIGRQV